MAQPTDISGLTNWYKADSLSLTNGASVSSWPDSSGSGNDLSQSTGASQPTYVASARNGLPGVQFSGSQWMSGNGGTSDGFTAFAVFTSSTTSSGVLLQNGNGDGWMLQLFNGYDLTWRVVADNSYGTYTANSWVIYDGYAASGSGNPAGVIVNGVTLSSGLTNGFNPPSAKTFVGSTDNQQSYVSGTISELIQYNRQLTALEIAEIDTYLSNRYAITTADYIATPSQSLTLNLRIPNKRVGPMAMRHNFRRSYIPQSGAAPVSTKHGFFF